MNISLMADAPVPQLPDVGMDWMIHAPMIGVLIGGIIYIVFVL